MRGGIPLAGLAALAIVVAGGVVLRDLDAWQSEVEAPAASDAAAAQAEVQGGAAAQPTDDALQGERRASGARRPASLRGTRVDGGLVTDASGRFVATADARRLFDYFLAASGEEPDAALIARVRAEIDRRLPPEAAREAHLLFDRYLAYRARARLLAAQGLASAPLEERLATLRALRRDALGDEAAAAFFAEEEAMDAVAVAKLGADVSDAADPEERARLRDAAEAALPETEREHRRAARVALDLRAAEAALAADGGTATDVQALRERTVGAEAAERLAALDARRTEWQRRLDAYRAARLGIEQDPTLDARARAAAIERLRAESFDDTERLRVEALDEIGPP